MYIKYIKNILHHKIKKRRKRMEKYEILFAILIIIAYIICSLTLKIPIAAHLMFGAILLVVLIIAILLKFKQKYENEKISKIFRILSIILIICCGIAIAFETIYQKTFFINSAIFIILILIVELISWVLRKNENG